VIAGAVKDPAKVRELQQTGAEVVFMPNSPGPRAKVDLPALMQELGRRGINELHVEAGYKLNGSLIMADCVDELLLYFAPSLLGDHARGIAELPELADLGGRRVLAIRDVRRIGDDIRVIARMARN
jgi:diaminohydroxyphosphoribosylaminopyrimidine deaminase/5-amino-6-(5-phosphoribosylamino)uracil reductase